LLEFSPIALAGGKAKCRLQDESHKNLHSPPYMVIIIPHVKDVKQAHIADKSTSMEPTPGGNFESTGVTSVLPVKSQPKVQIIFPLPMSLIIGTEILAGQHHGLTKIS
jgi:hypothetical protein